MQNLKRLGAAVILTFMLGASSFAGIMETPPCAPDPGIMGTPPCAAAPGQIETPPGETNSPPADYSVAEFAITMLENAIFF